MLSVLSFLFKHWAMLGAALAVLAALGVSAYALGPSVLLKRWKLVLAVLIAGSMFLAGLYEGGFCRGKAQRASEVDMRSNAYIASS